MRAVSTLVSIPLLAPDEGVGMIAGKARESAYATKSL
jgi:hypothetical protein